MATFFNSATLSYNGNVTSSNIVSGELVEVLTATKTAVRGEYRANETITYVISIVNSGAAAIGNVTVSDDLGAYTLDPDGATLTPLTYVDGSVLYYSDGVLQGAPTVTAGPPLTITGITVPAGGDVVIVYEAVPNQFAPLDRASTIDNTATISSPELVNDVIAEGTVTAADAANLTISKSLSPSTVAENGQLTYTFIIQNYGNTPAGATDNVVLSDTFNPRLENLVVTFNGGAWTAPANYTYNETTGEFATVVGQLTVPAATYTQDPATGAWSVTPGVSTLVVTGTV